MFCAKCGAQLPDTSLFCSNCGSKLGDNFVQPQQYNGVQAKPRKKKGCLISILIAVGVLIIMFVIAALNGGEVNFSSANVAEAYMASQINESTSEPVVKTESFSQSDTIIYATARIKNVPSDTKVSAIWYYIPTGDSLRSENDIVADSDMWVQFSLANEKGFIPGEYKVEILLNDKAAETLNYIVN